MTAKNVNFRWPPEFIARIDGARGLIPRSAYVRQALERQMEEDETPRVYAYTEPGPIDEPPRVRYGVLGKGPVKPRPKGKK